MKRTLVAVSFAVLAVPAFAAEVGAPFEQTELDRALPTIQEQNDASSGPTSGSTSAQDSVWADDYNFIAPAK